MELSRGGNQDSMSSKLRSPSAIPILFRVDNCSLNSSVPAHVTKMRLRMMKTLMALDRDSYFNEIAQNTVPIKYIANPVIRMAVPFPSDHFLKRISPVTSNPTAISIKMKNQSFAFGMIRILLLKFAMQAGV